MTKLRIALAQVNATVGDLDGNAELIVAWTRRAAERGARVVVFPEMMLTGYPVEDLALRASFVEASIATLHAVAARLQAEGLGGVAVVTGYLDRRTDLAARTGLPAGAPQDAAALIHGGRVVITSAKHHLPNYGVFDEFRYFVPGDTLPVFRVPAGDASPGGRPPRPPRKGIARGDDPPRPPREGTRAWRSRSRSARTCGRTAGRCRSAGAQGRACWWCRTPHPTSGARTTCGWTWWCGGPARRGRRWPTPTWSAGRTSWSSTATRSWSARTARCSRAGRSSPRRSSSRTWTCRPRRTRRCRATSRWTPRTAR